MFPIILIIFSTILIKNFIDQPKQQENMLFKNILNKLCYQFTNQVNKGIFKPHGKYFKSEVIVMIKQYLNINNIIILKNKIIIINYLKKYKSYEVLVLYFNDQSLLQKIKFQNVSLNAITDFINKDLNNDIFVNIPKI